MSRAISLLVLAGLALAFAPPARAAGPTFGFGVETTVYDNASPANQMAQRCDGNAVCLATWPDTPLSAVPDGGGYDWYGANGPHSARTTGPASDPAQRVDGAALALQGPVPSDVSYASIGAVWQDTADGLLLAFVHLERWPHGCVPCYWASLALASSTDNGTTWTYQGEVFQPNFPYDPNATLNRESGPGVYAVVTPVDDPGTPYFYLYVRDTQASGAGTISVERARVADVVAAVRAHAALPGFLKLDGGAWTSPGLGGPSTNIAGPYGAGGAPWSVSYNTALGQYVMALADYTSGRGYPALTLVAGTAAGFDPAQGARTSTLDVGHDIVYGSIFQPGGSTPSQQSGATFDLYYVGWGPGCTWTCAYLAVRTVTVGGAPPDPGQASGGFSSTQGQGGWSYASSADGERSSPPMTWDAGNGRWQGSEQFCLVGSTWQHPGLGCDSIRAWTAPSAGDVSLGADGPISVAASCGGNTAGVAVRILKNGTQVWPASGAVSVANGASSIFPHSVAVAVGAGDQLQFVVGHNGSSNNCDTTTWDQTVIFRPGLHRASSGFGSGQGGNGWSYQGSGDGERTFQPMTWDAGNGRWQGSEQFCLVGPYWQHPGVACDSARVWTSSVSGTVALGANGPISVAAGCAGNTAGVGLRILKNGAQLWTAGVGNGGSAVFPQGVTASVVPGDQLQFVVDHNGTGNACDTTIWDPTVTET